MYSLQQAHSDEVKVIFRDLDIVTSDTSTWDQGSKSLSCYRGNGGKEEEKER